MTLKSMTGFARRDGSEEPFTWHWEVRTLNSRGLDIRLRLPLGFEAIEGRAREMCKAQLARGNCTLNLTVKRTLEEGRMRLDEQALMDVAAIVKRAQELIEVKKPALDALLGIKGVIVQADEEGAADTKGQHEAILADLALLLADLEASRIAEGKHLQTVLGGHIDEIETHVGEIEASPARAPEAILERLSSQISRLLQTNQEFDEQRLHQEALAVGAPPRRLEAEEGPHQQTGEAGSLALVAIPDPQTGLSAFIRVERHATAVRRPGARPARAVHAAEPDRLARTGMAERGLHPRVALGKGEAGVGVGGVDPARHGV